MWNLAAQGMRRIAVAAPREHAKSTAITHALTLFLFLFRIKKYGVIVSDTETQASQFLGDVLLELKENTKLIKVFGIKEIVKDSVTDIIVEMSDGWKFRIQAKGTGQKVRGLKWNNRRPDWIVIDDLENDELVENEERRGKVKNWFLKALLPSLAKSGNIFIVGTILHMDSLLMGLMTNKSWNHRLYQAHSGFDDFTQMLWPQQWSETRLRDKRQEYIDAGNPEGYSQEYLNDPLSHSETYFKKNDFKPYEEVMDKLPTTNYASVDLAISDKDRAAYTVILVGGMDQYRRLLIKHVVRFRSNDANEIIGTMFEVQRIYGIETWIVEEGQIKNTLMGPLIEKMQHSGVYLNIPRGFNPQTDKRSRARAIQARLRAGGVYFPKEREWYGAFEEELLHFPKGRYKDQVDAISWLGIAINQLNEGPTTKELEDDDYQERLQEIGHTYIGRSAVTGY